MDASDQDGGMRILNWPVLGMYQPDAIDTLHYRGATYLFTANEGDSRPAEETRVGSVTLDLLAFPDAAQLQLNANLDRLRITNLRGDIDGDGDFDQLHSFGGRSFSIWTALGDVSPEGLLFVRADESPTGRPLLIVSHEISGTVTIYEIARS